MNFMTKPLILFSMITPLMMMGSIVIAPLPHSLFEEEEGFDEIEYTDYNDLIYDPLDSVHSKHANNTYAATLTNVESSPNFEFLSPLCGWAPTDKIKRTVAVTTQFARDAFLIP
jgi:hypothetical protein